MFKTIMSIYFVRVLMVLVRLYETIQQSNPKVIPHTGYDSHLQKLSVSVMNQ